MNGAFYVCSVVAILSTAAVITGRNAVHALLYLIVSLFAVALIFVTLGAPFVAALEIIVYAGAIMVLFVFVVILLNVTPEALRREQEWLAPSAWIGPSILTAALLIALVAILFGHGTALGSKPVGPSIVGAALYSVYTIGVELASMLLLAGLVGAYHLGHRAADVEEKLDSGSTVQDARERVLSADEPPLGQLPSVGGEAVSRVAQSGRR